MKIKLFLFVYVLLLPILLAAGGSQEPSLSGKETPKETSVTIVDSLNRTIVLPSLPERVVQAGSSSFIVNDALFLFPEAAKRVVAMADSNQGRGHFLSVADPLYDEKTILPTTINMEEVLAAKPDLVIMKDFLFSKYDKEFQKVGIPVIYLNLESPEAWFEDLDVLGTLFGNPARADHLKELFSTYISQVTQPLSALKEGERKKDLILYYSEKDGSGAFQVPPLTFIQTEMLKISGADPIWKDADLGKRWTKVGFEQIAAWDPDQIFLISYRKPMEEVLNILAESPYWQELRSYKKGEIHPFPMDFHSWDQPDPRWLIGLLWMASQVHPVQFPAFSTDTAETFFSNFYNISPEDFQNRILPLTEGIGE